MSRQDGYISPYTNKFRMMLKLYTHSDGEEWTGPEMEADTNGEVTAEFFSDLLEGTAHIPNPEQLLAIAEAMGFPVEFWFRGSWWWETIYEDWKQGEDVEDRLHDPKPDPDEVLQLLVDIGYYRSMDRAYYLNSPRAYRIPADAPSACCTPEEAAWILDVNEERILLMLEMEELEGMRYHSTGREKVKVSSVVKRAHLPPTMP